MTENLAGRGEGLAGRISRILDEHRFTSWAAQERNCSCGWKVDVENPKVYDWQHRLHVGLVIETALEAAAPPSTAPRPYRALNEGGGCKECHHGDDWTVVYTPPDGSEEIGEGETWDNESPADEMAESLNDAFERGWRAALATPSPQASAEQSNAFSTTSAREQSAATASSSPSMGFPHNLPATRQELSELRKLFDWHLSDLRKTIQAEHYYMKEWLKPYAPAATQEQPAGSGADELRQLINHIWVHSGYPDNGYQQMTTREKALYDEIKRMDVDVAGSPRKVGEDGALKVGDELWIKSRVIAKHEVRGVLIRVDGIGEPVMLQTWVPAEHFDKLRPSSVPVGEQKD